MSSVPFPKAELQHLKQFIELCKKQPEVLEHADLAFFKQYILSLGGRIPSAKAAGDSPKKPPQPKPAEPEPEQTEEPAEEEPEQEESDIELDNSGVIEPDTDEPQPMGDKDKEVSEEDIDKSDDKKRDAISAFGSGEYEDAVKHYTEAILLNPGSALLYAKRGQAYLSLNKPNACIRDCERALEINPDSAPAYKFRGRAHRLLGHWEEAARDLRNACKIDFNEEADEWLREVTPNARRLEEHQRKYERLRAEKDVRQRLERARRAREQHARAAQQQQQQEQQAAGDDAPGEGGGMGDFYKLLNDPEILAAFQDPEVAAAFQDISANPANIIKYQSNPKVATVINKLASKFGGMGGMGGLGGMGGMGGMGGFPGGFPGGGFGAAPGAAPSAPGGDDVGLD